MTPDIHSVSAAWIADTVGAIVGNLPGLDYVRIPCRCGGSVTVLLTGDPVEDTDAMVDAFTRPHPEGDHEEPPAELEARHALRQLEQQPPTQRLYLVDGTD
jgi:hypothetical protein